MRFAGLEEFANRPAAALSGGMQKKLGLATALVHRPKVLLLDEPTGGVDPVARQEFWQLLIGLLRAGSAVLVSTPYMDEAMRFNRVIFMNHGRALTQGAPRDLMNRLDGRILELAAEPAAWLPARLPLKIRRWRMCTPLATICTCASAQPVALWNVSRSACRRRGIPLDHLKPVDAHPGGRIYPASGEWKTIQMTNDIPAA